MNPLISSPTEPRDSVRPVPGNDSSVALQDSNDDLGHAYAILRAICQSRAVNSVSLQGKSRPAPVIKEMIEKFCTASDFIAQLKPAIRQSIRHALIRFEEMVRRLHTRRLLTEDVSDETRYGIYLILASRLAIAQVLCKSDEAVTAIIYDPDVIETILCNNTFSQLSRSKIIHAVMNTPVNPGEYLRTMIQA